MNREDAARLTVLIAVSQQEETRQIFQSLSTEEDLKVEDTINDGFLLKEKVQLLAPDILILDYHLKNVDMRLFIEEYQTQSPSMTIVLIINKEDVVDLPFFYNASVRNVYQRPLEFIEIPAIVRNAFLVSFKRIKTRTAIYSNKKAGVVIALSSAKGGVGKSFLSANLSLVLANLKHNFKVLLLDFALPYGDQRAIMGIPPSSSQSVVDLVSIFEEITPERIKSVVVNSNVYPNVDLVLSSPNRTIQENFAEVVPKIFKSLRMIYDFVIIDLNPGIDEISRPILEKSDKILLPFTPEIPSILRLINYLKEFQWLKILNPPEIIYNRRSKKSDREVGNLLSKVLPYKIYATITEDIRTATHSYNFLTPAVLRKTPMRKDLLLLSQKLLQLHGDNK